MNWILITFQWYLTLLVIGVIFTPLTKKIFKSFHFDLGYPFAKTLGIILLSYFVFVLGIIKVLPFSRLSLIFALCLFVIINWVIYKKNKNIDSGVINHAPTIIFEELLFVFCLFFWTFIRSQEPSIHGLEKFMDFGFMNSILRTEFFPPKDIWYTPEPINYYYFGHLSGALLIKLSNIKASIGYNLILATIFAQGVTQVFSLIINIIKRYDQKFSHFKAIIYGLIGAYLVNLGGNLHTIYLFTKGYPNETPIAFWKIFSWFNPTSYWYPNATRFIPYTIHEFPSYSYVVADLHGHVFDIPFVLLTIAILFIFFTLSPSLSKASEGKQNLKSKVKSKKLFITIYNYLKLYITNFRILISSNSIRFNLIASVSLGFMSAIHYMTNAFDGPIFILLTLLVFFFMFGISIKFFVNSITLFISFIVFSLPFSWFFKPFVSGIGVNLSRCFPTLFTNIDQLGPFIFEKGTCQISPPWMLFILWGFFWISFGIFLIIKGREKALSFLYKRLNEFILILFSFGIFLTIIPEFFYIKDIYPDHFRANTMFKLGYQAFSIMGIASIITFFLIKQRHKYLTIIFIFFLFFPCIYPYFSVPSYYGKLDRKVQLDGQVWLKDNNLEDNEIVDYLNKNEKEQPVILEAQGDSYTDYERISAFTGLPTVAGWRVHEWLWRGSSDIVGNRIPEVVSLYESKDIDETNSLVNKYQIKYVIISRLERQKYPNLDEKKWLKIGKLIFKSSDDFGALYKLNQ